MELLSNLERLMLLHNMNRSELARACDLSTSTVNSWWNRGYKNISLQTLIKLSICFDCSIEEIVHGVPETSYTYDTNQFTQAELLLINKFSQFVKSLRNGEVVIDVE